ncbi:MAG: S8 family serine peptidase [Lachnospiraceae bacterium]|nr:S8 family serine peptidase [Lachnospiraceae bacterium]
MKKRWMLSILLAAVLAVSSPVGVLAETAGPVSEGGTETEETLTEDSSEADESGEEAISSENASLPYGLKGMPEGYEESEKNRNSRSEMNKRDVAGSFDRKTAGYDYVEDEILFYAEDEDQAEIIAEAYNAELISFSYEMGVARLSGDISVAEAVRAGLDENLGLPVVEANYIVHLNEPVGHETDDSFMGGFEMPSAAAYKDWVHGDPAQGVAPILNNADPYLKNTLNPDEYQWQHEMVDSYGAWSATTGDSNIKVAVIDTGVDSTHEDLAGRVTYIQVPGITPAPAAGQTHGTHCAGIIAASLNNGKGGAGIAPGVSILSLNVFGDSDSFMYADLVNALHLAADNGADLASMSLGGWGDGSYDRLQDAIDYAYKKGVTLIAAAGNDDTDSFHYPAACNNVICVASVDRYGARSEFSNFGAWVDIAAPGSHIMSTVPGGYEVMSGTSMATPVVSGVVALYMSKFGNPGPHRMETILKAGATKASSSSIGRGIVNAYNLFASDKTAPVITAYDKNNIKIDRPDKGVGAGSYVKIESPLTDSLYGTDYIIYTTDGKTPALKDGEIVAGDVYDGSISLDRFPSDTNVTVKAVSVSECGTVSDAASLTVRTADLTERKPAPIGKAKLDKTSVSLTYKLNNGTEAAVSVSELTDNQGNPVNINDYKHEWISSNEKVVKIKSEAGGTVTVKATGKGKAAVTLKFLDGSKKTATCNVNVSRLPDAVKITGQSAIAPGSAVTFKAQLVPSDVDSKNVTWTIESTDPAVTIDGTGKVSVGNNVKGGSFTVKAAAEGGASSSKAFTVKTKASSVAIVKADGSNLRASYEYDKKGVLKAVQIYSVNLPDSTYAENILKLNALMNGSAKTDDVEWTCDKAGTVNVSGNGTATLTALKEGSVKLTCKMTDGSKKSASLTVRVINPASSLTLTPNDNDQTLATGRTRIIYPAIGNAYGMPSVKKIDYTWKAYGGVTFKFYEDTNQIIGFNPGTRDITDHVKDAVSIKDGKVSVAQSKWERGLEKAGYDRDSIIELKVTGITTDKTGYTGTLSFFVQPPAKVLTYERWEPNWVYCDRYVGTISAVSSNPKILGAGYSGYCEQSTDGGYWYNIILYGVRGGSANVKVHLNDGTGKKLNYGVRIRN